MRERLATVALSDWSRAAGGPEGWDNSATAALITPLCWRRTEEFRRARKRKGFCVWQLCNSNLREHVKNIMLQFSDGMAGEERQVSCLSSLSLLLTILLLVPSCNSGAVQLDTNNIDGLSCHLPHLSCHPYHLNTYILLFYSNHHWDFVFRDSWEQRPGAD